MSILLQTVPIRCTKNLAEAVPVEDIIHFRITNKRRISR
jgi:hypothetical protein